MAERKTCNRNKYSCKSNDCQCPQCQRPSAMSMPKAQIWIDPVPYGHLETIRESATPYPQCPPQPKVDRFPRAAGANGSPLSTTANGHVADVCKAKSHLQPAPHPKVCRSLAPLTGELRWSVKGHLLVVVSKTAHDQAVVSTTTHSCLQSQRPSAISW